MTKNYITDEVGFEHLHLHTDFSLLDGYGMVEEYASRAPKINQKYLCVTDHGMMGVIPRQIRACEENNITPCFGCELYVQDKHPPKDIFEKMTSEEKREIRKSYHLLAIAFNEVGYKNLVQLSSWAWLNGFYYRPRVTHQQLMLYKEGIIFTSCCYNGEIGQAFDKGGEEAGFEMLEKYMAMFGENFYLELMLLDFKKQKPYDAFIVKCHDKYHLPIIVSNDAHYAEKEDSKNQQYMLMIQKESSIKEIEKKLNDDDKADIFELQDTNLWMKSEEELNTKWLEMYQDVIPYDLYVKAKKTTVDICRKAGNVEIDRGSKLPQIPDADEKFKEAVIEGLKWRGLDKKKQYVYRMKEEFELIRRKGFSSYFLIQKQAMDEARRVCPKMIGWGDGSEAIGPGRGCLSPDSKISMKNGISKNISEVKIGDEVVTIDGTHQKVLDVLKYPVKENLLEITNYYGSNLGVKLTKDHKVWVEKGAARCGTGKFEWLRADQISEGDWVFVPTPKIETKQIEEIDLSIFANGNNLHFDEQYVYQDCINPLTGQIRKRKQMKRKIHLDEDWHVIVGLFAGDGWVRADGSGRVGFCFHSENNLESLKLLEKKLLEVDVDYFVKKQQESIQVLINNRFFYLLFKNWFNQYECTSQSKHVPDFIFTQNDQSKLAYLRGYLFSDGHSKDPHKLRSTSERLASQTRYLCWQLGIPASFVENKRLDKRSNKESKEYKVCIPHVESLAGYRKLENGLAFRVRKIREISDVSDVYDLTVENNHNYLTDSFLVHNSAVGSLACYCLGITDVDPIHHDLLFSRFLSESRGGKQMRLKFTKKPLKAA